MNFGESELVAQVTSLLRKHGADDVAADAVATMLVAAERDGALAHGLRRLPAYVKALDAKVVAGAARMSITHPAPGILHVDAANGFAQAALARVKDSAAEKARANGICAVAIHDSHHLGVLWPDVEQFARDGFVCLAFVNSRSLIVAPGARQMVLGTNPIAFAVPRPDAPPLVVDQASSVMSYADVTLAAQLGLEVEETVGVDQKGNATQDPNHIVGGGALLPFGGYKGFWIALLVEVFAAALTGSRFGYENKRLPTDEGETSNNAGQMLILIDPVQAGATDFCARIETLFQVIVSAGTERLPGNRRYRARAMAERDGIEVGDALLDFLLSSAS